MSQLPLTSGQATGLPSGPAIKEKVGRDGAIQRFFIAVIGLYLLVTLAFPLYTVFSKAFDTFYYDLSQFSIQVSDESGNFVKAPINLKDLNEQLAIKTIDDLKTKSDGRLSLVGFFPDYSFKSPIKYRLENLTDDATFLYGSDRHKGKESIEVDSNSFRRILIRPARDRGLSNFAKFFSTPALSNSIYNSLTIAIISMIITVSLAFWFAYALNRSCMRFKGFFKLVAMLPILVPSLLPGIALVYIFGNQGFLKSLLLGESIYGPIGIVMGSVFFTFPHAMLIISAALSISDARLYEAADSLGASKWRKFWTVTLPGAKYGLISACIVVFNLVITDFGLPKVIGGSYNVLAVDIYKQVIGQQNFQMGAVVSVVLLLPAVLAFMIDRYVQRTQVAGLSARSVVFEPKPSKTADRAWLAYCGFVALFIVSILLVCQFAALVTYWPYNLNFTLANYDFSKTDGGGWGSFINSIELAVLTAVVGTIVVFLGAYMVEKTKNFNKGRALFQMLAMLPMAIPGMVLGLSYIFFFNHPDNPLNFIYGTMIILVISTVTHFYTVTHLTAVTALKQMDTEYESVCSSLKMPFTKLLGRVTIPVCMPEILNLSIYLFVNAMTTVSAVVFIYSTDTELASVAVLNMDDAGDIASASAMGMMIFYTNVAARSLHAFASRSILKRSKAWRAQS